MSDDELKQEIETLKTQIKKKCTEQTDTDLKKYASDQKQSSEHLNIRVRRTLKGHIAKVYECDFCENEPDQIVSCSQDGKLIVWNGLTTHKLYVIPLKSQWVLTCAYSPGGRYVSCGGLDNTLYLFKLTEDDSIPQTSIDLKGHEGSISRTRFLDDERVISTSGDKSAILWNISATNVEQQFNGHLGDVLCLDVNKDRNTFVTGSIDKSCMLWDLRTGEAEISYTGHSADVNSVKYFPGYNSFASGSDDGTIRLFDLRANRELMVFTQPEDEAFRVLSVAFSQSGRYLFSACHFSTFIWDTLSGKNTGSLEDDDIISWVGVNPNGRALYSASWNSFIKVYA